MKSKDVLKAVYQENCSSRERTKNSRKHITMAKTMSEFFELRSKNLWDDYYTLLQQASDFYEEEQRLYRAWKIRERWHLVQYATAIIQRVGRGMLGRLKAKAALMKRAELCNKAYFDHCATTIQKIFRGF